MYRYINENRLMQLLQRSIARKYTMNLTSSNLSVPPSENDQYYERGADVEENLIKDLLAVLSFGNSNYQTNNFIMHLQENPHIHAQIQSFLKVRDHLYMIFIDYSILIDCFLSLSRLQGINVIWILLILLFYLCKQF